MAKSRVVFALLICMTLSLGLFSYSIAQQTCTTLDAGGNKVSCGWAWPNALARLASSSVASFFPIVTFIGLMRKSAPLVFLSVGVFALVMVGFVVSTVMDVQYVMDDESSKCSNTAVTTESVNLHCRQPGFVVTAALDVSLAFLWFIATIAFLFFARVWNQKQKVVDVTSYEYLLRQWSCMHKHDIKHKGEKGKHKRSETETKRENPNQIKPKEPSKSLRVSVL